MVDSPPNSVSARLHTVREAIALAAKEAGRQSKEIRLVAVAKTATPDGLEQAFEAGQVHFAHNRVQDLAIAKKILPAAQWHLIGPLQKNKIRKAVSLCGCFQALGDIRTAQALQRVLAEKGDKLKVLVQVKDEADLRNGIQISNLIALMSQLAGESNLEMMGLMTLALPEWDDATLRHHFARVRKAAEEAARQLLLPSRPILSMGMSGDYRLAIAEGATLVRLGRAIFPTPTNHES